MRRVAIVVALLTALSGIGLAGCADNQPGDNNTGPGVATDVSDLVVKINALKNDPCLNKKAEQIYPQCGRFVTEAANVVGTFRQDQPQHSATADALQGSINTYQQTGCDSIAGSPSLAQSVKCPVSLAAIGPLLDLMAKDLASTQSSASAPTGTN